MGIGACTWKSFDDWPRGYLLVRPMVVNLDESWWMISLCLKNCFYFGFVFIVKGAVGGSKYNTKQGTIHDKKY